MTEEVHNADRLKKLESICEPDARNPIFSRFDELGLREDTLDDHHAAIARICLSLDVPSDVIIQFETAKNIYLYAWYVYRFFPVAEQQALATLEMGLRMRFPDPSLSAHRNKNGGVRPTLAPLLRFAISQGLIRNEGFSRWHALVRARARDRMMYEDIEQMQALGLLVKEVQLSEIVATAQDRDVDFVGGLDKILAGIRNGYAHGSSRLHNQVLGTFELVSEILEQVYRPAVGSEV